MGLQNAPSRTATSRMFLTREAQALDRKTMAQGQTQPARSPVPQARSLKVPSGIGRPIEVQPGVVFTDCGCSIEVQPGDRSATSPKREVRTHLQTELKELRSTLEKKQAQHQHIGAMVQTKLLTGDEQCIAQQVQQVSYVASEALEHEVKELCATVSSQQAEQAIFLQMLTGEIDDLRKQVQDSRKVGSPASSPQLNSFHTPEIDELRKMVMANEQWKLLQEKTVESMHSELDALTLGLQTVKQEMRAIQDLTAINKSSADSEIKHLRFEIDNTLSQQQVQFKSLNVEIQNMKALATQQQDSSSLSGEVDHLIQWMEGWKAQHGTMIAAMDSEVKSLRFELQEKEGHNAGAADNKLLSLYTSLQEHQKEELGALQRCQGEMERKQKKQEEDYVQAMKRSTDLTKEMQSDMIILRELLEKSNIAQQDDDYPQESVQMIKTLSAEVENLRQKHEEIRANVSSKDLMMASQLQAELRDLHGAAEAQRSEVDAVLQQLGDHKAQLGALGSASKAVANVQEAEARAMRRSFEEQLQQHTEAIRSLSAQMTRLTDNLPTQPLPDAPMLAQDCDVTSIKNELDTLKLQSTLQRSLQTTEVAKEAAAIQNQLHKVVGSEREARVQESTEMRALIKNLYKDMAQLTQNLKPESKERTARTIGTYPTELMEPLEIKRLVTTDLSFGCASPDVVDCSAGEPPFSAVLNS